jgi:hypothetical protein
MSKLVTSRLTGRQPKTGKQPVKRSPKPRKNTATWWAGTRSEIAGLPESAVTLTAPTSKPIESPLSATQVRYTPRVAATLGRPMPPIEDWKQSDLGFDESKQYLLLRQMPPAMQEEATKWLLRTTIQPIWI